MIRIAAPILVGAALLGAPALAQDYEAPAGIDAQPLPAPAGVPDTSGPLNLAPPPQSEAPPVASRAPLPVSPHEGPQEKALDQSLDLPTTYVPANTAPVAGTPVAGTPVAGMPVKPSPREDMTIEEQIEAASHNAGHAAPPPERAPAAPPQPPTQTVYAPATNPSTVAPASSSRWEGPQERALDQVQPDAQAAPTIIAPEDPETRRLNGGY